jgi:hypothetical protein
MNAIQFETVVENDTIQIPERYRGTVHRGKVQVTILDEGVPENKNAKAWRRFLQGIKASTDDEPIEFERVNFTREVVL